MRSPSEGRRGWFARHRILLRVGGSYLLAVVVVAVGWAMSAWPVVTTGAFVGFLLGGIFATDFADFYVSFCGAPNLFAPFTHTGAKRFYRIVAVLSIPWYIRMMNSLSS